MSTNADARLKSETISDLPRRRFLAAGAATLAGGASLGAVAAATAGTNAEAIGAELFDRWWTAHRAVEQPDLSDAEGDRLFAVMSAAEDAVKAGPASVTKAATLLLIIAKWELLDICETHATMADEIARDGKSGCVALSMAGLAALRPFLSGPVARLVADTLDGQHRPTIDSLLIGCGWTREA